MGSVRGAVELFEGGCACSQAVLVACGQGLGMDRAVAMRVAAGFAGGMRSGDTCGAVTGAIMVLGLRHCSGDADAAQGRKRAYNAVLEFRARFRDRCGSVGCRELLGCDIGTPEGSKRAHDLDLFKTVCPRLVEAAATILDEMAAEDASAR